MRIGFSPSVYEHAAFLINRRPWEVSRRADLMVAGHRRAYELYNPAAIIVGIDIYNLEAEAYGAEVVDAGGVGIPAIVEPLFTDLDAAGDITPFDPAKDGRLPMIIECGMKLAEVMPPEKVHIPVSGPFSIASFVGSRAPPGAGAPLSLPAGRRPAGLLPGHRGAGSVHRPL